MHQHGPNELLGPLRGTAAWWRGMGATPEFSGEGPQVQVQERKRGQRRHKQNNEPGIRIELVQRVRKEIEAGTYDRPETWEKALDRLLERLEGE